MKKALFTLLITATTFTGFAQVAVNTDGSSPNSHAMLDVQSSDKGMLIPRMTTAQRTTFGGALSTTEKGMMVFDTDLLELYVFDGSSWIAATSYWTRSDDYVFNITDSIGIATATPGSELDVYGHIWQTGTGSSVFLGEGAGANDDFSANYNAFVGKGAGNLNTVGFQNVALGHEALHKNISGNKNIAIGNRALYRSTKNSNLIAIGDSALFAADSGYIIGFEDQPWFAKNVIAIGNNALKIQSGGENNIAIGHGAVENGWLHESIVMGDSALISGRADSSIVIGYKALFNNIHVDFYPHASVIIGDHAMYNFGNWADGGTYSDFSQNIVIGRRAFYNLVWGEHNVAMGAHVGHGITDARHNVAIGDDAMSYIGTPASSEPQYNVSVGNVSGRSTTDNMYNTSVGYGAGGYVKFYNVAVGYGALGGGATLKENNVAVGAMSLNSCKTNGNIGVGYQALQNNADGDYNLALGYRAGVNSSGSNNIFIGINAGQDESGSNLLLIGNTSPIIKGDLSTLQLIFNGQIKINGGNPGAGKVLTSDASGLATWETPAAPGAYEIDDLTDAVYDGSSLFLGYGSGSHDGGSNSNTAVGKNALWTNISGTQNVAIGENAGYQSTGNGNVFIGYYAGSQETGSNKLYIANSMTSSPLIGGDFSTSQVDINGTIKITGGTPGTGKVLTSDANGLASWENAVQQINDLSDGKTTTGSCVFLGTNAGASVTTGTGNSALGVEALNAVAGGSQNTAMGYRALYSNASGTGNTAVGFNVFNGNSSGSSNTAIGHYAGFLNNGSGNVFLGYQAGYNETGSDKLYIANSNTSTPLIGGDFSTSQVDINGTIKITGGSPGAGKVLTSDATGLASWGTAPVSADGSINTHSDVDVSTTTPVSGQVLSWDGTNWVPADDANTTYTAGTGLDLTGTVFSLNSGIDNLTDAKSDGSWNLFMGNGAGASHTASAFYNTATGINALNANTAGNNNTAYGFEALKSNTANSNTAFGFYALTANSSGTENVALGSNALASNSGGSNNTAAGSSSLTANTSGDDNVSFGYQALQNNSSGSQNTAVGREALKNNSSANNNVAIGYRTLNSVSTNANNTAVGTSAGYLASGSGNVFIGYQAGYNETGSNKLYIANSNTSTPLIGGDFSTSQVDINGTIKITGGYPGSGKVLTSNATGLASWEDPATPTLGINDLTDGVNNGNSVFLGDYAGINNGTLGGNTGTGNSALSSNTSGTNNSAFGSGALVFLTAGNNNTAIGFGAGAFDASGNQMTALGSDIFIGSYTKASANADTNMIVIGRFAVGLGSNTVVIGNSDIQKNAFYGKVGIGTTDPKSALQVNGGMQVADDTDTAAADKVGTLRYRSDSNNSYVEMCVQTGATTYAWVIIHQETW